MVADDAGPDAPEGRARRRWRGQGATAVAIVVSVTLLVTGSVFAFVAANENDGAATPTEAVHEMVAAVEAGDPIGILDALPPGERQVLTAGLAPLGEQLQRLGLMGGALGQGTPPVSVTVDDLALRADDLAIDQAAVTTTNGTLRVQWNAGSSITPQLQQVLHDDLGVEPDPDGGVYVRDLAADPVTLFTLRDGGGWHVSLGYTVAESLRPEPGPTPRFGSGPVAWGGDSPAEAVTDLYRAGAALDAERAVALMSPRESRALYDYATLFLPDLKADALARQQDDGFRSQITDVQVRVEGTGSERKVVVTRLVMSDQDRRMRTVLTYDGACTDRVVTTFADLDDPSHTPAAEAAPVRTCDGQLPAPDPGGEQADQERQDPFVLERAWYERLGRGAPTFWVTERDGRWYVSPTRTVLATLTDALTAAGPGDVDAISAALAGLRTLYLDPAD